MVLKAFPPERSSLRGVRGRRVQNLRVTMHDLAQMGCIPGTCPAVWPQYGVPGIPVLISSRRLRLTLSYLLLAAIFGGNTAYGSSPAGSQRAPFLILKTRSFSDSLRSLTDKSVLTR